MSFRETKIRRRAAALVVVLLLMTVLSVFTLTAVDFLCSSFIYGNVVEGDARVQGLVELAQAEAVDYVETQALGPWPYEKALAEVADAYGESAGEYSFTIVDRTLPEQNARRQIQIQAYWPDHENPISHAELQVWMEKVDTEWFITAWGKNSYIIE